MWCIVVLTFLISTHEVFGGYDYPKPSISFELPNFKVSPNTGSNTFIENNLEKTISYSLPHEDYQYLQEHKHKETENNIKEIGNVFKSEQLNTQQDPADIASLSTESNSHHTFSIESSNKEIPVINDLNLIDTKPEHQAENNVQIIPNADETVLPLVPQHNSKTHTDFHNIINSQSLDIQNSASITENTNKGSNLLSLLNIPFIDQHRGQIPNVDFINNIDLSTKTQTINTSPQHVHNVITPVEAPLLKLLNFLPVERNTIHTSSSFKVQSNQEEIVNVENTNFAGSNLDTPLVHEGVSTLTNLEATVPDGLQLQNNQLYTSNAPTLQFNGPNVITPLITKSISFHVPPPDIEERPVAQTIQSPKKVCKIIFIKLPSQESTPNIQLETALNNRINPVEDKTVIYVLVKKPEKYPNQIYAQQLRKPSEHEVLFVNYRDTPNFNADEIKENIAL